MFFFIVNNNSQLFHFFPSFFPLSFGLPIVTPALGAGALQALLEAAVQHRSKRDEMLRQLSREFCQKVRLA